MTTLVLIALAVEFTAILAAPSVGHAQTFLVEKSISKARAARTASPSKPQRATCSFPVPPTCLVIEGATGRVLGTFRTRQACMAPASLPRLVTASREQARTDTPFRLPPRLARGRRCHPGDGVALSVAPTE